MSTSALSSAEHPWLPQDHAPFAGKYSVERILGQGGMGTVFEARHIRLGQRVAIKVLGSALREYPELVQRFEREARACGSLSSAHAVRILDIDTIEDGTPFIVMELLAGRDLSQLVEREGPQPVSRAVRWVVEACDAIAEAHRLGIIHRDLKPSNMFLAEVDGRSIVKVLDFGIAKRVTSNDASITAALCPLGTPQYMSPEQVRCAKDVDVRTDVWSLGVTLYELVTGSTPFPHESSSACIAAIAADPVPDPRVLRPHLGDAFVAVLMRALAKSAQDRYQSVEELVAALAPFATSDEDEVVVSNVRRAIKSSPDLITLTPAEVAATYEVRTFGPRDPLESRPDRTAAPVVALAEPPIRRRLRSSIAIASAAACALAVLSLTLHLGAGDVGAASTSLPVAAQLGAPALPSLEVAPIVTAPPAAAPPAEADSVPAPPVSPTPVVVATAQAPLGEIVPKPLIARPLVAALGSATGEAKRPHVPAARANEKTGPQATASHGVHGGLSSPGF